MLSGSAVATGSRDVKEGTTELRGTEETSGSALVDETIRELSD